MKRLNRMLVMFGCIALLAISWVTAATSPEDDLVKQKELLEKAEAYLNDEVYILTVPLLEEAVTYDTECTPQAEEMLKETYLKLIELGKNYTGDYRDLLEKQMERDDAGEEVFFEAANFYIGAGKYDEALTVLKRGIEQTSSQELTDLYEANRYRYSIDYYSYEEVKSIYKNTIAVKMGGKWGLANAAGKLIIPCEYDEISTPDGDRVIVRIGTTVTAVDSENNRLALLHQDAFGITNLSQDRIGINTGDGYTLATGEFAMSPYKLEELGMFSDGYAAAKYGGKWGLLGLDGETWLLEPSYSDIIRDELGRSYSLNSIFAVESDGNIVLLSAGKKVGEGYENARPFIDGWAAVEKGGKWGFVDTQGNVMIEFKYDDALSFSGHLAAVKKGNLWGYLSLYGKIVIEPTFIEAKSFVNGRAPIRTDSGWGFIALEEYGG